MLAQEDFYDVRLEVGQHAALVADLEQAVLEQPMRERLLGPADDRPLPLSPSG